MGEVGEAFGGQLDLRPLRIAQIKAELAETKSTYDREKLEERLAKLAGGVAQLQVGAATESEMKERKMRVDDAVHATRAAVEEGIVPGGGVALLRAAAAIDKLGLDGAEKVGAEIVKRALARPLQQIARNAGCDGTVVADKVLANKDAAFGFNADTLAYGDMLKIIETRAKAGVGLSTIGFGMGNYKDTTMEQLADKGNGNNYYIDSSDQAKRVFETQLTQMLEVVAKDVKLQVDFDPAMVARRASGDPSGGGGASPDGRAGLRAALGAVVSQASAMLGVSAMAVGHMVMVGVMAMTPVRIVGSGSGANKGEWRNGRAVPAFLLSATLAGSVAPSQNMAAGIC